jgi:nicotinamide mononucleotide adenylyltransferase
MAKRKNILMDYKKPTAQMLGRWQPFHDGHLALFKKILEKTGQVIIMVRDMPQTENNPFVFEDIKKRIEEKLKDYTGKFDVIKVPNITNICYGRDVGYKIEEVVLPKEIQEISATKIRKEYGI